MEMTGQFVFVSASNDSGRVKAKDQAVIRSRCMQGVNKKSNSRRSLLAARAANLAPVAKGQSQTTARTTATDTATLQAFYGDESDNPLGHSEAGLEALSDYLTHDYWPKLGPEVLQLIHDDSEVYPREFVFNCE